MIETEARRHRRRGEELAIRRRHQQRGGIAAVEEAPLLILDHDAPDGAVERRAAGEGVDALPERLPARAGSDQAKENASSDGPCSRFSHAAAMIRSIPRRLATAWDFRYSPQSRAKG